MITSEETDRYNTLDISKERSYEAAYYIETSPTSWLTSVQTKVEKTIKNCPICCEAHHQQVPMTTKNIKRGEKVIDTWQIDYIGPLSKRRDTDMHSHP